MPNLPATWRSTPIPLAALADSPGESKLQVMVMYWSGSCSHTAVRILTAERPTLFWDPGGSYGKPDNRLPSYIRPAKVTRQDDLITENAPDLETYFTFRRALGNTGVEVFEWILSKEQAERLHDILLSGSRSGRRAEFRSKAAPMFCSNAASRFLHLFAGDVLDVPQKYFFPHRLARLLYSQSPDRVLLYQPANQTLLHARP